MSASSRGAGRFTKRDRRRATPRGRDPRADVGTGSRGSPAAITRASLRAGTGANPRRVWPGKSGVPRLLLAGAGRGGRSLGRRRRVDARLGRNTPHVALDSTARDHPVREERARVSGERSHNPYCDLAGDRETNRLMIDPRLRAIGIHRGYPPQPSQLKKTHNQPAKSRPVLHDWFDPGCRRGASARGIPTDEAECSEAGHPRGICAIPERVGPETCRRSRR